MNNFYLTKIYDIIGHDLFDIYRAFSQPKF